MSSNPRAERAPRAWAGSRVRARWSLRTRLLVTQVLLLAAVCAGIGIATEFALQRFLMNQLDEQVVEAGRRSAVIFDFGPPPPPGMGPSGCRPPGVLLAPPRIAGADACVIRDRRGARTRVPERARSGDPHRRRGGVRRHGPATRASSPPTAPAPRSAPPRPQQLAAVAVDEQPEDRRTRRAGPLPGGRASRPRARARRSSPVCPPPTSTTPCCGCSSSSVSSRPSRWSARGDGGLVIVRRQLAPLARVSAAAQQVADLELDRGEVRLPTPIVKVDPAAAHTEVGQLGGGAEPDARPHRRRAVGAARQRDPGAAVRRRRQPRTAHPAGRHPRLHRTGATQARRAARRRRPRDEPRRVRDRADDPARRGHAAAGPAGRRAAAGSATRST